MLVDISRLTFLFLGHLYRFLDLHHCFFLLLFLQYQYTITTGNLVSTIKSLSLILHVYRFWAYVFYICNIINVLAVRLLLLYKNCDLPVDLIKVFILFLYLVNVFCSSGGILLATFILSLR